MTLDPPFLQALSNLRQNTNNAKRSSLELTRLRQNSWRC